jgi:hypothetical protein
MLERFCALGAGIFLHICLYLRRDELSRKTGDLPVDQVLESLVLGQLLLLRGQVPHLFLLVFIRASR